MTSKPPSPFKTSHIYNRSKKKNINIKRYIDLGINQCDRAMREQKKSHKERKNTHSPFTTNNINPYHHYPSYPST